MLPVYRIRDGADSLKNNEFIFNKSSEILEHKMAMALFPEALHFGKRSLRPLKKAIPRIVFLTEEKNNFNVDIEIVPVGIYYDNYINTNSLLQINYGKPISIKDYKERYLENPQKAMLELRDEIYIKIKPLIIDIEDLEYYEIYEKCRYILRKKTAKKNKIHAPNKNWFKIDKITIFKIATLDKSMKEELKTLLEKFQIIFDKTGLKSYEIAKTNWIKFILNILMLIAGLPIFIFALINNFIPYYYIHKFLKDKIKDPQFHSSIKFVIGLFVLPLFYFLLSLIPLIIFRDFYWDYFFALTLTSLISIKYKLLYNNTLIHFALIRARITRKNEYRNLITIYNQISRIVLG